MLGQLGNEAKQKAEQAKVQLGLLASQGDPRAQAMLAELQAQGLIKGGTAESAIVCDRERWLTGPLRFANEPARHKLLDLVGDLALLGGQLPCAHVVAWKASHKLHVRLAQQILAAQRQQQPERAPEAEPWAQLGAALG